MRIRSRRTRSFLTGIMALVVMILGLLMMGGRNGVAGSSWLFRVIWVAPFQS